MSSQVKRLQVKQLQHWLELHGAAPAYAGGVLLVLTLIFFLAASNTLAGWLYVIGAVNLALLTVAAVLPIRSLRPLAVERLPISPVAAGDPLELALQLSLRGRQPASLLEIRDLLPARLGKPAETILEALEPGDVYVWCYRVETWQRGVYLWQTVQLRTAAPLGLFWCRRQRVAPARAIVYPVVLPLSHCPLIDQLGQTRDLQHHHQTRQAQLSNHGETRSLRPYRWGDPVRLVHWRSSARYGELRVRELEMFSGLQQVLICLQTATIWSGEDFEQAVIAAASLYFYARRQHLEPELWTEDVGRVRGEQAVLETLARIQANPEGVVARQPLPDLPLIWLSPSPGSLEQLPPGSRWLLWRQSGSKQVPGMGRVIDPAQPLQPQLQARI